MCGQSIDYEFTRARLLHRLDIDQSGAEIPHVAERAFVAEAIATA
jgi:hypothetical protein